MSKNGFQTKVWGAPAWIFLHCISFNYSNEKKKEYKIFFKILKDILPCKTCRDNYNKIITKGPLKIKDEIFKNRKTFSKWLFLVHNKIQYDIYSKNNKDLPTYKNKDYNKVKILFEKFRAKCSKNQYGCTEPYKKDGKKRSIIIVKKFNKKICPQKNALTVYKR